MIRYARWLLLGIAACAEAAAPDAKTARTVALFSELQEAPPFSAEDMAARQKDAVGNVEGAAADLALNNWKLCVTDALSRWAPLHQGPGTLIDGAFGRCADIERDYRAHLMRITQDGRVVVDVAMARSMTRMLEEAWRPRLTAMALDQDLARQQPLVEAPTPKP
ncbi:hypothetical protein [Sphingomonas crusticola]|uniref:hypothetical protein n=1 Tax=Sphingomonas crusticola TaxID=1697973 RepID=UPI000E23E77F|nr:hypothetical protein [Sphingomonas crusticola]